jgi:hypothetical protein
MFKMYIQKEQTKAMACSLLSIPEPQPLIAEAIQISNWKGNRGQETGPVTNGEKELRCGQWPPAKGLSLGSSGSSVITGISFTVMWTFLFGIQQATHVRMKHRAREMQ